MQIKENKLPRWAQSTVGVSQIDESNLKKSEFVNEPFGNDKVLEEIEDVFSNTLEKAVNRQDPHTGGVQKSLFYGRIDEEEEFDDKQKSANGATLADQQYTLGGVDPDEQIIKEQIRMRNMVHKSMLGLDEEDEEEESGNEEEKKKTSDGSGVLAKNNNRGALMMMRWSDNRQSQSQLFLQRKHQQ